MKAHLLRLSGQTLIYGLSGASLSVLGLFTLPVFARELNRTEYGALELVIVAVSVFGIIVDLGLGSASQRSYFDYPAEQKRERGRVLSTAILTSLSIALLVTLVICLFARPLAAWLLDDEDYALLIVISMLALPVGTLGQLFREVMRLTSRPWHYLISSLTAAVVGAGVAVLAVLAYDGGPTAIQAAGLLGGALAMVYGFAVVRGDIGPGFSRRELGIMLRYGLPLVPSGAALWGLNLVDRIFLAELASLDEVAVYAVANRVASVLMLAVVAFNLAYVPFFLSLYAEDRQQERELRARVLLYAAVALFFLSLGLGLFSEEAIAVVAPGYDEAVPSACVLLFAIAVFGLGNVPLAGISIARATGRIAIYTGVALVINVICCIVLIPLWGQLGAALGTLLAYGVLTLLYYRASQLLDPAPFEPRRVLTVAAVTGIAMLAALAPIESALLFAGFKALVFAAALAVLWPLGVIGPMERQFLRETLRRRRTA